jgi:single-strand DNA-binding protein
MSAMSPPEAVEQVNEVRLVGVLAAASEQRELPSGDTIVAFRVVVRRSDSIDGRGRRGPSVDAIDCTAWRGDVRRTVSAWTPGDVVEVVGALRRRFWRGPHGAASRFDVAVARARRVSRGTRAGSEQP